MDIKYNYHIHTRWCGHATGEIEDYIKQAINDGLEEIAITDHMPIDNGIPRAMKESEFNDFDAELNTCIEKYQSKIHVLKGMECEYYPDYIHFYKKLKAKGYEVLLLSQHNSRDLSINYFDDVSDDDIKLYAEEYCEGLETGLFKIAAHPDLFLCQKKELSETAKKALHKIFACCEKYNILVEINVTPFFDTTRNYTNIEAYKIAKEYNVLFCVGSDAHSSNRIIDENYFKALKFANELDLPLFDHKSGIVSRETK